jgi:hypothetical protein
MPEPPRSRQARALAEEALIRLIQAYGETPEFVLLGGLVPDLLCRRGEHAHVGTTDVDVQVDLEIHGGARNAARLESALGAAGFHPDAQRVWRWRAPSAPGVLVKIEFLADMIDQPDKAIINFDGCTSLGAANLRGTGFASRDWEPRELRATIDSVDVSVVVRVATLPAYVLAKSHAAYGRSLEKDWYDIAYVVLHNDEGGPRAAAARVTAVFAADLVGQTATALGEVLANFRDDRAQGSVAYARTMFGLYPDMDVDVLANDAVTGIAEFMRAIGLA